MQAVILAGGKGTRLRPYTTVIPKPLMPIGDYPILEVILRQLKAAGVEEVILAVGYMSQLFQAFFQDGANYGLRIKYSFEDEPLGTAGPIGLLIDQLQDDFLVMNGDLLTTLNYRELFAHHKATGAAATISLHQRDVKIDLGVVEMDAENRLANYIEKPTYHFHVSMGINVFNTDAIRPYVKRGVYLDIPTLMMQLHQGGKLVTCYRSACEWLDIGRIDDYQTAVDKFLEHHDLFLPPSR